MRVLAFLGKAHAFYFLGDSRAALTLADRCLDSFSICHDRMYLAEVNKLKGIIHREIHKEEFARWYLFTSLKISLEPENLLKVGSCHYELGRLHLQRGKASEANRAFQKSVQYFKNVGPSHEVERASIELQSMKEKTTNEFRRPRKTKI